MRTERLRRIVSGCVVIFVCAIGVRASSHVAAVTLVYNQTRACPGGGHVTITGNINKSADGKMSGALKYQFGSPISNGDDCIDANGNVVTGTLYGTASGPQIAPSLNIDGALTMSQRQADGSYLPVGHCRAFLSWLHGAKQPVGENCGLPFPFSPNGGGGGSGSGSGSGDECRCFCNSGQDCTDGLPNPQAFCQAQNGDQFNVCGCPVAGNGCDGHGHPSFAPSMTSGPDEAGSR
jgi:hypothetical protein